MAAWSVAWQRDGACVRWLGTEPLQSDPVLVGTGGQSGNRSEVVPFMLQRNSGKSRCGLEDESPVGACSLLEPLAVRTQPEVGDPV